MKRRDVIKGLTMLPLAGGIVGSAKAAINAEGLGIAGIVGGENSAAGSMKFGPEVYRSLVRLL